MRLSGSAALAVLCFLAPVFAAAEIFRYQDEQGNWHFTDDAPEHFESSVVPGITTSKEKAQDGTPESDLASQLQSTFDPITPIAYATMAVVSIKGDTSEGSGFFCSEEGHIITNLHLVKPESAKDREQGDAAVKDHEQELKTLETELNEARTQLESMKQDLKGYEELIEDARDEKTRTLAANGHKRLLNDYARVRGRFSTLDRSVRKTKTRLRDEKRNAAFESGFGIPKTHFDIVLKDGTELTAKLIETSKEQDLALLKLDGYKTPYLRLDPSTPLSQGIRVFSIGNPLGMQAAVSSGVITQIGPDHLYTDAQILPGSSGGPLIRESGEVIGINVARRVAAGTSKYAAGFGKAIPVSLAVREFPSALAAAAVEASHPGLTRTQDPYWGVTFEPLESESPKGGRADEPNVGRVRDFGIDGTEDHSAEGIDTHTSEPVRLILSDQEGALEPEPTQEPPPRSLDFPPEGGLEPGISFPRR